MGRKHKKKTLKAKVRRLRRIRKKEGR